MIKGIKKMAVCLTLAMAVTQAAPVAQTFSTTMVAQAAQRKGTVNSAVYMRSSGSSSSSILTTLNAKQEIIVLDTSSGWYKVKANGKTGYVWKSFITLGAKVSSSSVDTSTQQGKVKTLWVAARSKANFTSSIKKVLVKGTKVTITSTSGSFYKIKHNDTTGYVAKKYIKLVDSNSTTTTTAEKTTTNNSSTTKVTGEEVVNYAKKFVGNRYVWGGTSLTNGTDCSGFTMSVYKHFGYSIPRTSYEQREAGRAVSSLSAAKPGDLICYSGHVALYMGDNKIVHASSSTTGIIISNNASYRSIVAIRRIIN